MRYVAVTHLVVCWQQPTSDMWLLGLSHVGLDPSHKTCGAAGKRKPASCPACFSIGSAKCGSYQAPDPSSNAMRAVQKTDSVVWYSI